jgi:AraC-like DNA-binding protein
MLLLDVLLRYPAVAVLLVTAALCLRDAGRLVQAWLGAGLTVSVAAMLVGTAPDILQPPFPALVVIRLIDMPNMLFLWLFGRSLFDDEFRMRAADWLVAGLALTLWLLLRLSELDLIGGAPNWLPQAANLFSAGLALHLVWTALVGRGDDLVETRRSIRLWFVIALGSVAGLIIFGEALFSHAHDGAVSTIRAGLILAIAVWGLLWLTRLRTEALLFQPAPVPVPASSSRISPKDALLLARLTRLMEEERAYAEQGLTIGALAKRAGVPEHQLRALINGSLGHRNFAAFLNGYRIVLAKQMLSDPALARVPVLTIAMDSGFASLAPFNRAFRALEGMTPTEFREMALTKTGQN